MHVICIFLKEKEYEKKRKKKGKRKRRKEKKEKKRDQSEKGEPEKEREVEEAGVRGGKISFHFHPLKPNLDYYLSNILVLF